MYEQNKMKKPIQSLRCLHSNYIYSITNISGLPTKYLYHIIAPLLLLLLFFFYIYTNKRIVFAICILFFSKLLWKKWFVASLYWSECVSIFVSLPLFHFTWIYPTRIHTHNYVIKPARIHIRFKVFLHMIWLVLILSLFHFIHYFRITLLVNAIKLSEGFWKETVLMTNTKNQF